MDALTPARLALRLLIRQNERRPSNGQVSLVHTARSSMHSVTKHLAHPIIAFVLPAKRDGLPASCGFRVTRSRSRGFRQPAASRRYRSGLRLGSAGSSLRTAESRSQYCYGLHIRLRLLPTPPRGDAVTFGYRERASPETGLAPARSRLLPGARIPACAGMTKKVLLGLLSSASYLAQHQNRTKKRSSPQTPSVPLTITIGGRCAAMHPRRISAQDLSADRVGGGSAACTV